LCAREHFPKVAGKSSASAKKWLELVHHRDHNELRRHLQKEQQTIYATAINPAARSIYEIDWTNPATIILGNEHRGVSREAIQIADHSIYIPMYGMVESLNVSVAAAIILYEACRQRQITDKYFKKKNRQWLNKKLNEWIKP
jgi:tRNA (guanosine-2'-O-)-methyltransferase